MEWESENIEIRYPETWQEAIREPFDNYSLVDLDPNSYEYNIIASGIDIIDKIVINKIQRIQNDILYRNFYLEWHRMSLIDQSRVNFMNLFHGTRALFVHSICNNNFDTDLSGKVNGSVYGKGAYFAKKFSKSHDYTKPGINDLKYIFVVQCLVGKYCLGNYNILNQPRGYESCVDNLLHPSLFVLFNSNKLYPAYSITYR